MKLESIKKSKLDGLKGIGIADKYLSDLNKHKITFWFWVKEQLKLNHW